MGGPGSLFSYGCAWANLSNTPLSFYKHYAHEGGIRTPLIAHWPARISDKGALRQHVTHVMDLMATFVEVADAPYPEAIGGRDILPMEGRSLVAAFEDRPGRPRTLVFEHERNAAVREGGWKLVAHDVIRREGLRPNPVWELYDLAADPLEQRNRASMHPERVERMSRKFLEEALRTLVLPAP
jgi:arylsulfatase